MQTLFVIIAAITLSSALMAVTSRHLMHAALWLVVALLGVAVLFAMLEAGFFAVVQVLIYVGAIAILIIFAIMLTRKVMEDTGPQVVKGWWAAALAAAVLLTGLILVFSNWNHTGDLAGASPDGQLIAMLGTDLVNPLRFAVPFEVASVLLIAALVGAIYIASDRKGGQR